jgi:hypothetical protein
MRLTPHTRDHDPLTVLNSNIGSFDIFDALLANQKRKKKNYNPAVKKDTTGENFEK